MRQVLSERSNFATISLYKNYCFIHEAPTLNNNNEIRCVTHNRFQYNPAKSSLFYYKGSFYDAKFNGFPAKKTFKDSGIKRNYNNPFCELSIHLLCRTINVHENKITINLYYLNKHRGFNFKYYKKNRFTKTFVFDFKNNNFKVIKNRITQNFTTLLNEMVFNNIAGVDLHKVSPNHFLNDFEFLGNVIQILKNEFNIDLPTIVTDSLNNVFSYLYFTRNSIEIPRNFIFYSSLINFTKKMMNGNKNLVNIIKTKYQIDDTPLVDSILINYHINPQCLYFLKKIWARDFTKYISKISINSWYCFSALSPRFDFFLDFTAYETNEIAEKENVYKVIDSLGTEGISLTNGIQEILSFYHLIKRFADNGLYVFFHVTNIKELRKTYNVYLKILNRRIIF